MMPKTYPSADHNDYYNHNYIHNHPTFEPSRATIIVPHGDIQILPNPNSLDIGSTKVSSYHNNGYHPSKSPCDRCYSETQNYIDLVRNEIARTVELQTAKGKTYSCN